MDKRSHGFTLIEALLSCLILAVGAVVICGLSRHCMQNSVRGWEYEQAYRLLDESLDKVVAAGVGRMAQEEKLAGDFGERYPHYRYRVKIKPAAQADLYQVRAIVSWYIPGQQYQVQATTLIYDLHKTQKAQVGIFH